MTETAPENKAVLDLDPALADLLEPVDDTAPSVVLPPIDIDAISEVDIYLDTEPSPAIFDTSSVATRQAGFTVEPYVVVNGHPIAGVPSATVSLAISGYGYAPLRGAVPPVEATKVVGRWIPSTDTWNGLTLAPVAGIDPFSFAALDNAGEPALLDSLYAYTVEGRWVSSSGLDFDGSESIGADAGAGAEEIGVAMAVVLRRPLGSDYVVLDFTGQAVAQLRYDAATDTLEAYQEGSRLSYTDHVASETDLVVLGMHVNALSGAVRIGLGASAARMRTVTRRVSQAPRATSSMQTITVGGSADGAGFARMTVVDMAVVEGTADDFDDVMSDYVAGYLTSTSRRG